MDIPLRCYERSSREFYKHKQTGWHYPRQIHSLYFQLTLVTLHLLYKFLSIHYY